MASKLTREKELAAYIKTQPGVEAEGGSCVLRAPFCFPSGGSGNQLQFACKFGLALVPPATSCVPPLFSVRVKADLFGR
ncbi:MAG: hypothetical protein QOE55_246 [Acidobacteriaceae bacterium]|jgi:hypothetical protein|nr:hypothetical protein [Acidobacteriaceae bacterium]